jgi:hypothetical protein
VLVVELVNFYEGLNDSGYIHQGINGPKFLLDFCRQLAHSGSVCNVGLEAKKALTIFAG